MALSKKQIEAVRFAHNDLTLQVAEGSVRSGKTFAHGIGWGTWALRRMRHADHLIAGQTVESVMRNVVRPPGGLLDFFTACGYEPKIVNRFGLQLEVPTDKGVLRAYITGANDLRSYKKVQGATFGGLLLDEGPLVPHSFWQMVWSRLSIEGAKAWVSLNPESPAHWWHREVNERITELRGRVLRFTMRDNPALSAEYRERLEQSYTGHWHARLVEGIWAAVSGLIFPNWHHSEEEPSGANSVLSLDYGVASTLALLLHRRNSSRSVVWDEFGWESKERGQRDHETMAGLIRDWLSSRDCPNGTVIWVDPATPLLFKRELRRIGLSVRNADNDVLPGLMTTDARLTHGGITVHPRCTNLKRDLQGYRWDPKAAERGEDVPIKENDHWVDSLRYYAHSTGKAMAAGAVPIGEVLNHAD